MFRPWVHAIIALLLCSCRMVDQTRDPAESFKATKAIRQKDGSVTVYGARTIFYVSSTIAVPTAVSGGLRAQVTKTGTVYDVCMIVSEYHPKASSDHPEDFERKLWSSPAIPRSVLDKFAASGSDLRLRYPQWHSSTQRLSAAYIRGFLQKVDEVRKDPAAANADHRPPASVQVSAKTARS